MVKCKKHGIFVTGCSRWNGSYLSEVCEECDLRGRDFDRRSDTLGQEETIRRSCSRPDKIQRNTLKKASTWKVQPYFNPRRFV